MYDNGRELIDRLVACGYTVNTATDICQKYAAENKWRDLMEYVRANELLYNDCKQYPGER